MTEKQWQDIQAKLTYPGMSIRMKIDGYNVALQSQYENADRMKLVIAVYIDDKMDADMLKPENEVCLKFMCPCKKCILTQKQIAEFSRSKKKQKALKDKYTYTYYIPYWSSFRRLKSHFIKNNTSIELIDWSGQ
mgnify:CR=1 FL=1